MIEEILEVVDPQGIPIKTALRSEIHGNPSLLHRVVHLLVINKKGEILLQKRSAHKDVAPNKWDTSVGGHVDVGESLEEALKRETREELGFHCHSPIFLYSYIHSNDYESELVYTYLCVYEGPFEFNREEIIEIRFWRLQDIDSNLHTDIMSENFKSEYKRYIEHIKQVIQ